MTDWSKNMSLRRGAKPPVCPVAYAVSVALTGTYAPAALAQDATADLEAVIVTARKREETLLDIPQEVQAISQQEMERANISTVQDLQRFVPSLTYKATTPGRASIYFRGVADDSSSFVADSSAAVYLDEQPLTQSQMQPEVRLVDIERIEALPGPQGTLYGSSSQSGTLRYITNKPDPTGFYADVSLDGHTVDHGDEGYELSGVLNLPVGENTAIRLVGFSARDAGFIDNVLGESLGGTFDNADVVDKDVNAVEYLGGRAAVRWLAGENWTVDVGVVHQQLDANTYAEDNVQRAGRELAVVRFLDEFRSDEWTQLALTLQGDLGWGQLTSATSYFTRDIAYLQDNTDYTFYVSSFSDPNSCADDPTWENCAFAFGTGPGGPRRARQRLRRPLRPGVPAPGRDGEGDLDRRSLLRAHGERIRFLQPHRELRRHAGVRLLEHRVRRPAGHDRQLRLQLEGQPGHRTDRRVRRGELFAERTLGRDRRAALVRPHARSRALDAAPQRTRVVLRRRQGVDQRHHQETVGAVQHQRERDGIRAVLGRDSAPGGRNVSAPGVVLPADYDPDFLDNYELGFKSRWDGGRYTFNITAFKMKWEDYQVEVVDPGALPLFYVVVVTNIGNAEIEGISADFTAYLWDSLDFGLNVQFLDPRVTREQCARRHADR